MTAMFTEEEREQIRSQLIKIGYEIFKSATLKKTSVSEIAMRCGIAKGSFYNFFPSKHAYAIALMQELSTEKMKEFYVMSGERGKITLEEFMLWYRGFFIEDANPYFCLKIEDVLWIRDNMQDDSFFNPEAGVQTVKYFVSMIDGVKADIDYGVLANFGKMIYAMALNRDTFCKEAMQKNIDLVLHTMYQYMKGDVE